MSWNVASTAGCGPDLHFAVERPPSATLLTVARSTKYDARTRPVKHGSEALSTEYQIPSTTSEVGSLLPLMHVRDFTGQPRTAEVSEVGGDQASRQGVNVVAGILFWQDVHVDRKIQGTQPNLIDRTTI